MSVEPLVLDLADALRAAGLHIATAESCTGGLIAAACTAVAGSSDWFERGFVTYSNAAKTELLGVGETLLRDHGAVSQPVALAMADGALRRAPVQRSVAVTGIAGPGGGTAEKPTGLVHLHLSGADGSERAERVVWASDRRGNKLLSAQLALQMLWEFAVRS